MESFNGKYYTTNSESYTDEHNIIMDELISSYCVHNFLIGNNKINYDEVKDAYYPVNETGAVILEHLLNCDLISVVAD